MVVVKEIETEIDAEECRPVQHEYFDKHEGDGHFLPERGFWTDSDQVDVSETREQK